MYLPKYPTETQHCCAILCFSIFIFCGFTTCLLYMWVLQLLGHVSFLYLHFISADQKHVLWTFVLGFESFLALKHVSSKAWFILVLSTRSAQLCVNEWNHFSSLAPSRGPFHEGNLYITHLRKLVTARLRQMSKVQKYKLYMMHHTDLTEITVWWTITSFRQMKIRTDDCLTKMKFFFVTENDSILFLKV